MKTLDPEYFWLVMIVVLVASILRVYHDLT